MLGPGWSHLPALAALMPALMYACSSSRVPQGVPWAGSSTNRQKPSSSALSIQPLVSMKLTAFRPSGTFITTNMAPWGVPWGT